MKDLITSVSTSSPEVVKAIHASGHRIVLEEKGPVRWTYHTTASEGECLAALKKYRTHGEVGPIPGGTPGFR